MKKWISLFTVLTLLVGVTACGSDKPDDLPVSLDASVSKSGSLLATAGAPQTVPVTFELSGFTSVTQYVKYINDADALATSYFEITGIGTSQEVNLTNVSLSLASDSKKSISLPDITKNERFTADTSDRLRFMQFVVDEIKREGSSDVTFRYTPTTNMANVSNKFTLKMDVRFSFD